MKKVFGILMLIVLLSTGCVRTTSFQKGRVDPASFAEVSLPFEYVKGLIVVNVTVNGQPGRFIIDNGFSMTGLDRAFAQKCGISSKRTTSARDGNNNQTSIGQAVAEEIRLGEVAFKNTGVYLVDTKQFLPCDQIDGLIGGTIINKVNWKFDFDRQLVLLSPDPFEEEGFRIPVRFNKSNTHYIDFVINGRKVPTQIDFGYNGHLKLKKKEFYADFKGLSAQKFVGIGSRSVSGLGNIDTVYRLTDTIQFGTLDTLLPIYPIIELTKNVRYSRMGLEFLKNFNMVINSRQREYILTPVEDQEQPRPKDDYGLSIYPVDGVYKVILIKSSEIMAEGVELMAEVDAIDELSLEGPKDLCEFAEYLRQKRNKEESFTLRLKGREEAVKVPFRVPPSTILE